MMYSILRYAPVTKRNVEVKEGAATEITVKLSKPSTEQGPLIKNLEDMMEFVKTFSNTTHRTPIPGLKEPTGQKLEPFYFNLLSIWFISSLMLRGCLD